MTFDKSVVHVNTNGDPAGVSWLLHDAMVRHGYKSRHIVSADRHIHLLQQNKDIVAEHKLDMTYQIINSADVLHFNNSMEDSMRRHNGQIKEELLLTKYVKKPFILHNHGGAILLNPEPQLRKAKSYGQKFIYAVCSPLTKHILPNAVWLPNIVPLDNPLYKPVERSYDGTIKICQKFFSPDVTPWKGTAVLQNTINEWLNQRYNFPVRFDTFTMMDVRECLGKSADHHICIDNITQGFIGMSGWESLAKGQVVIARLDPLVRRYYGLLGKGSCPIINVSGMDELAFVLRRFCEDRNFLKKKCAESRAWMEKYYNEERILRIYSNLYEHLLEKDTIPSDEELYK